MLFGLRSGSPLGILVQRVTRPPPTLEDSLPPHLSPPARNFLEERAGKGAITFPRSAPSQEARLHPSPTSLYWKGPRPGYPWGLVRMGLKRGLYSGRINAREGVTGPRVPQKAAKARAPTPVAPLSLLPHGPRPVLGAAREGREGLSPGR